MSPRVLPGRFVFAIAPWKTEVIKDGPGGQEMMSKEEARSLMVDSLERKPFYLARFVQEMALGDRYDWIETRSMEAADEWLENIQAEHDYGKPIYDDDDDGEFD